MRISRFLMERSINTYPRELYRDGIRWIVYEVDSSRVPGARASHCLIFESDGVVRRAWNYPSDWESLDDDRLWALLEQKVPAITIADERPTPSDRAVMPGPAGDEASAVATRARSLVTEVASIRHSADPLGPRPGAPLDRCRALRLEMHAAIARYAESLRHDGVPPERVLVLVKAAMADGIGSACLDEPVAEQVLHEGIERCIQAYYAA